MKAKTDLKELERYLRRLGKVGADNRQLKSLGKIVEAGIQREFETQGGGAWKKLKTRDKSGQSYRPKKGRKEYGYVLLRDTGRMYKSLTTQIVGKGKVLIGFCVKYARYQNSLRPFLVLRERTKKTLIDTIRRMLKPK